MRVCFPAARKHTVGVATQPMDEPLVTAKEYLRTSYEPEGDYVDGPLTVPICPVGTIVALGCWIRSIADHSHETQIFET